MTVSSVDRPSQMAPVAPACPECPPAAPAPVPPAMPVPLMGGDHVQTSSASRRGDVPAPAPAQVPVLSPDQGAPPRPWFDQRGYAFNHTWFNTPTGDIQTNGGRIELETTLVEGKVGRVAAVGGMTASVGNQSFHVNPAVGIRGELGQRDVLSVYATAMGGANIGALNGDYTSGWQGRVAGGLEHKFLFAEYAYEHATNYTSQGVTAGLRFHF